VKEIIACILVLLLSVIALVPMASGSITPLDGSSLSEGTIMKSDPPPDLVVNDELPKWQSRVFEVAEVMPGDSGAATLKLQNVGGNGTLELQFLNIKDESITTPEPEPTPDNGELSRNLDMLIWWDNNQDGVYDELLGENKVAEGKLYNIANVIYDLGSLDYMETKYLGMGWSIGGTVGNEIMRDRCTFDIQFGIY
jgi:hypothetical protein